MRDPKRIERLLNEINRIWKCDPDQRFHQLIYNLQSLYYKDTRKGVAKHCYDVDHHGLKRYAGKHIDLYDLEDEEFIDYLQQFKGFR